MSGWKRLSALFLGLGLAPASAEALPLVTARIAPEAATVGDRIEVLLTLTRTGPLPSEPHFPVWKGRWGEAEILETGRVERSEGPEGPIYRQRLVLSSFQTGRVELPPTALRVPTGSGDVPVFTPSNLALDIRSVLPSAEKEKDPKPKPPNPPRALPIGREVWWTLGGLGAASALLFWADFRRRRQAAGPSPKPFLPPLEELLQSLQALGAGTSPSEAHTRLSVALRRYLGRRLPFPALESTTSEIQRQLSSRRMPSAIAGRMVELLRACDLVKFARRPAAGEETLRRYDIARGLAQELESHLAPPAPPPVPADRALRGAAR